MSKEELLKYLIAEIDLIMHDKDYRFENANGTWYSRESCRDLTNEEVFEELRTELRQFADLETKLAESEKKAYSRGHSQRDIANEIKLNALREDVANKEKRIVELKQQLADKDIHIRKLEEENKQLKQSQKHLAIEQLEKVEEILWNSQDIGNVIDNDKFLEKLNYLIKSLKGE